MSIEQTKAELIRRAEANEKYARFMEYGIGSLIHERAPYDSSDMDKSWVNPRQLGESLDRHINTAIDRAEQFARTCEPRQHHAQSSEAEARDQALGIIDYEMGVNARLGNMYQKVQDALGHLREAGAGCEALIARFAQVGEAMQENHQFFDAEAQYLIEQADQL